MRVNRIDCDSFTYNLTTNELRYTLSCNNPSGGLTHKELKELFRTEIMTVNQAVMTALLNKKILTLVRNRDDSPNEEEVWVTYINFKNCNHDTCSIR